MKKRSEDVKRKPSRADWEQYEREKRKLQNLPLSPDEYDARIYEIAKKLGV